MNKKEYIESKTFSFFELQNEMEEYAKEKHIPIISRDSLDFLIGILKIKKPKSVLEFGTAIAYSAIAMAVNLPEDAKIITLERDLQRVEEANAYIERMGLQHKIEVHAVDATAADVLIRNNRFDFVFIDAAKGQYRLFFDMVYDSVSEGGILLSDNVFYKEMVLRDNALQVDKRYRTIYRRMNEYLSFLKTKNEEFFTTLVPIGDGIAVTYKNERNMNE